MGFKVDFIGVGAAKCGTTWVSYLLKQHPEICFAEKKEIHYFNKYVNKYKAKDVLNHKYQKGLEYYRSFWPKKIKKGVKIGEFTPTYLTDRFAAKKIKSFFPNVKIIIMLRNPVDKAYSLYKTRKYFGVDDTYRLDFQKVLEKDKTLVEECSYYKDLRRYFGVFNKKKVRVYVLEKIQKDVDGFLKELYGFIGVNKKFKPDLTPKNVSKDFQPTKIRFFFIYFLNIPVKIFGLFKPRIPKKIMSKIYELKLSWFLSRVRVNTFNALDRFGFSYDKKKEMVLTKEVRKKTMKYFIKDINKTEKLLNIDLSMWKK